MSLERYGLSASRTWGIRTVTSPSAERSRASS